MDEISVINIIRTRRLHSCPSRYILLTWSQNPCAFENDRVWYMHTYIHTSRRLITVTFSPGPTLLFLQPPCIFFPTERQFSFRKNICRKYSFIRVKEVFKVSWTHNSVISLTVSKCPSATFLLKNWHFDKSYRILIYIGIWLSNYRRGLDFLNLQIVTTSNSSAIANSHTL
jgi:hypothetical protein